MPGSARYPILCKGGQGLCGERGRRAAAGAKCLSVRPAGAFSQAPGTAGRAAGGMEKTQKERSFCCHAQTDLWYNGLETGGSSPRRRERPVWMRAGGRCGSRCVCPSRRRSGRGVPSMPGGTSPCRTAGSWRLRVVFCVSAAALRKEAAGQNAGKVWPGAGGRPVCASRFQSGGRIAGERARALRAVRDQDYECRFGTESR